MKTEIRLDHERAPDGSGYVVRALLEIHGEVPDDVERTPLNLGIVLDRSSSMFGEPIEHAKGAATLLVRRLAPEDTVSVVAYNDQVQTVAEPATGEAQHDLAARIAEITAQGWTNLSGGWLRGRDLVAGSRRDDAMHRLLLLTDGIANEGITDPDQLVGLCRQARKEAITTTTIGFGAGYDEHLLRAMAEAGGGAMYYIERADQAPAVFAEEIAGLLSLSAQEMTVEIRPTPAARLSLVHHRYPSEPTDGGLRLELGDLYARDPRRVLAEFFVPVNASGGHTTGAANGESDGLDEIAELIITAHVLTPGGGIERQEVHAPIRASLAEGPKTDPEVQREILLQEAARAREDAYEARREGDFEHARDRLQAVAASIESSGLDIDDAASAELHEEAEDLRSMASRFHTGRVDESDAKYLYQRGYARRTSRASADRAISRAPREEE